MEKWRKKRKRCTGQDSADKPTFFSSEPTVLARYFLRHPLDNDNNRRSKNLPTSLRACGGVRPPSELANGHEAFSRMIRADLARTVAIEDAFGRRFSTGGVPGWTGEWDEIEREEEEE